MLDFGSSEFEFFILGTGADNRRVYKVERKRDLKDGREIWNTGITLAIENCVHESGFYLAKFAKPVILHDFSSFRESKDKHTRQIEIAEGWHEFEIISVEVPRKLGIRAVEYALIPDTTYGLAWSGLMRAQMDHLPYWKRQEQLRILGILKAKLLARVFEESQLKNRRLA